MKTYEEIDPHEFLIKEDFVKLFSPLPLLDNEMLELQNEYYSIYTKFIEGGVNPETSWLATRNIFIVKNNQIKQRLEEN